MTHIHCHRDASHHHLHITGHAGYASAGSDIVCAGVSAIAYALLGYLRQTGTAAEEARCRPGELKLRCGRCDAADMAFDMALTGWRRIAAAYPHHAEVDITPSEKGEEKENTYADQHHRDGSVPNG